METGTIERAKKGTSTGTSERVGQPSIDEVRQQSQEVYEFIMGNLSSVLSLEKQRVVGEEFRDVVAKTITDVRKRIAELLNEKLVFVRQTAWFAVLQVYFSQRVSNWFELVKLLDGMVTDGLLEQIQIKENVPGALKACGKKFVIPKISGFHQRKMEQITTIFYRLISRIREEEGQKVKAEQLIKHGEITLEDLLRGDPGYCCIDIPSEVTDGRLFRGGTLLVEGDGRGRIFSCDAAGSIENAIADSVEMGVFLILSSLANDWAPSQGNLENRGIRPERAKKIRLLWYLLKGAMKAQKINIEQIMQVA